MRAPSLFISHGSPMVALQDDAYTRALEAYFRSIPKPQAIIIVSAHTTTSDGEIEVGVAESHRIIHDFRGFPAELYQLDYRPPGDPALAARLVASLSGQGFSASLISRPLDHGMWVPLRIAYPEANVAVVPVSLPHPGKPEESLRVGRALAQFREEGVLVIGSGSLVHNLGKLIWSGKEGKALPFAEKFNAWADERLQAKDVMALSHFETEGPDAKLAHPTDEHYLPLLVSLGASLPGDALRTIHQGIEYGTLSMNTYALETPEAARLH